MKSDQAAQAIAKRIRTAREEAGYSQEELGRRMGLTKVGYGEYERGRRLFDTDQLFRLARILNRTVEYFLGLDTGLSEDEGRVVSAYRIAEDAGLGYVVLAAVEGMTERLRRTPGEGDQHIGDKPE